MREKKKRFFILVVIFKLWETRKPKSLRTLFLSILLFSSSSHPENQKRESTFVKGLQYRTVSAGRSFAGIQKARRSLCAIVLFPSALRFPIYSRYIRKGKTKQCRGLGVLKERLGKFHCAALRVHISSPKNQQWTCFQSFRLDSLGGKRTWLQCFFFFSVASFSRGRRRKAGDRWFFFFSFCFV